MKDKLKIDKKNILKIIIICVITYFVIDIIFYMFNFISLFVKNIEDVTFNLYGSNHLFIVNYLDAVNVKSYKSYLLFSYLSKIPFFVLKCYIAYSFIMLLSKYEDSLFTEEISDKVVSLCWASLLFFSLRFIYLLVDSIAFSKVFNNSDRISYYFNSNELIMCLFLILFMNFYFLAKKEKTKVVEIKTKNDLFSKVVAYLKEKI